MGQGASIDELRSRIAQIIERDSDCENSKIDALSQRTYSPPERLEEEANEAPLSIPQCEKDDVFKKIIALANVRDRSELSMRTRLVSYGFSEEAIDAGIEKALDYGFIDDSRFADVLIRSRLAQGKGCAGIERELKENGIDPESILGWPHDYGSPDENEVDRALALLSRKPPRAKNKRDGAYRKLIQNGFSSSIASTTARLWAEDMG